MKIRIIVEGTPVTATLDDSAAARDFATLLPLSLTLDDYESTEKISDLPRRLSTKGAPPGTDTNDTSQRRPHPARKSVDG